MNQPNVALESTNSPSPGPEVKTEVIVSMNSVRLSNTEVLRLISESKQMERRSFHNMDISARGTGFGRAYTGQIEDAIKDIKNLDSQMLTTEEGQKIIIAAAEQLFAERSFSRSDMADVQRLLTLATKGMLTSDQIEELKEVTLKTLKERLILPSELARQYNANLISRDKMSHMMAASYDWTQPGSKGATTVSGIPITDEAIKKAASWARAEAQRQQLENVKASFDAIEIDSLQDGQKEALIAGLTKLVDLLEDQSLLIRKRKGKEEELEVRESARIENVKDEIEQIMAQLQADGVVTDNSILTYFSQPGSLSAYQSLQEIVFVVRRFKAVLLGKDASEVDIGMIGIGNVALSSTLPLDRNR
jgi:hypothetical protein